MTRRFHFLSGWNYNKYRQESCEGGNEKNTGPRAHGRFRFSPSEATNLTSLPALLGGLVTEEDKAEPFIHIYSADKDDYVKITYSEANLAALNGDGNVDRVGRLMDTLKKALNKVHDKYNEVGKKKVAGEGMRKIMGLIANEKVLLICLNQIRTKIV